MGAIVDAFCPAHFPKGSKGAKALFQQPDSRRPANPG
jgi:hypothetical protein